MDYVCIDAYHGRRKGRPGWLIGDLFWHGLHNPKDNLAQFGKPIVITEYGGSAGACPEPQLIAEHRAGPWAALMAGYATGPMLWWIEWADQGGRYQPYTALSRFVAGEDLRSRSDSPASGRVLAASGPHGELWARGWYRPGRLLGYCLDPAWGFDGLAEPEHAGAAIAIGEQVAAGPMTLEWWHAETGEVVSTERFEHPGGPLAIEPPPFRRHIAFKLWRSGDESE